MGIEGYDPFDAGTDAVGVVTVQAPDRARGRVFPCEVWYPARPAATRHATGAVGHDRVEWRDAPPLPGEHPLVLYSHHSGGHRRSASLLCAHLASHGYVVAALDHSEVVAAELAPPGAAETAEQRAARLDEVVASRVPDLRFLLGLVLAGGDTGAVTDSDTGGDTGGPVPGLRLDPERVGLVGHSFGGWTALGLTETEPRVAAVVAHAPAGCRDPKPGVLPAPLALAWGRDVPTLYLAAEHDVPIPPEDVIDLYDRTRSTRWMYILRRADHQHFVDDVEALHEAVRATPFPGDAAWMPAAMRPIGELCSSAQAHAFVHGLTLAHLDASLRRRDTAATFLAGDVEAALAARGVEAVAHPPRHGHGSGGADGGS